MSQSKVSRVETGRLLVPQELGAEGIPALGDESGRGLFLVEEVSVKWGYYASSADQHGHGELFRRAGKVVWAVVGDNPF